MVAELVGTLEACAADASLARLEVRAPGGSYPILLGEGLVMRTGALMRAHGLRPGATAVITNPTVATHYLAPLVAGLQGAGCFRAARRAERLRPMRAVLAVAAFGSPASINLSEARSRLD